MAAKRKRRPSRKHLLAYAVVGAFLAGGSLQALPLNAAPAEATYATGGEGRFKPSIDWFEWGEADREVADGSTQTNTRMIEGQELTTSCTISEINGGLSTYRSGQWRGDGLDDLYNVGGTGEANEIVAGLRNTVQTTTVSFSFDCSAALDGVEVPLQGLVMADAEASGGSEYIQATPKGDATWRILDRIRSEECTRAGGLQLSATGTLRFQNVEECAMGAATGLGPVAVAFMEGAEGANMVVSAGSRGTTAVALGVVLDTDFGDAPESYGAAGAIFEPGWAGGEVPVGNSDYFSFDMATPTLPELRLGATIDGEVGHQFSPDARGDDDNGIDDEDAIEFDGPISVTPGQTYTLDGIECHGQGFVTGWIDWNRNGSFDENDASNTVACEGDTASLTWTVPEDAAQSVGDDTSFLRLRIAADEATSATPTGLATNGEVEDHAVQIQLPNLSIEKVSDAGETAAVGDTVNYTVQVTNTGTTDFTDAYPASMTDDLANVLDDATWNDDAEVSFSGASSSDAPTLDGTELSWSGPLAAGETATITYSVTLTNAGDGQVRNTACVPDEVAGSNEPCASTKTLLPNLEVVKSSDPESGTEVAPGENVTYTLSFTNTVENPDSVPQDVDYTDHMVDVLDDADLTSGPTTSDESLTATLTGDQIRVVGAIASGETVTVSYTVTVKDYADQGDGHLGNVVAQTGSDPVCVPDSSLCTEHPTSEQPGGNNPNDPGDNGNPDQPGGSDEDLAFTGGELSWLAAGLAALLLAAGGALLIRRKKGLIEQ